MRALGEFGIAIAASLIVFGYIIPVHLVPAIDDSTWTQASPRLALRSVSFVIGAVVVLAAGGVALIIASSGSGRRKQWSTPLSVGALPRRPQLELTGRQPWRIDSGDELVDELVEHRRVAHRVGVVVGDRDQPLLVEARRQQHAPVDPVDPLREGEIEVGRLVVAVVPDRFGATT